MVSYLDIDFIAVWQSILIDLTLLVRLISGAPSSVSHSQINFIVPTVFSIIQFICVYCNVDPMILNQFVLVNTVLTTVWAGRTRRQEVQILESEHNSTASPPMAIYMYLDWKPGA